MIKQLKKTNDIDEANRLLDNGWVLLAENIETFLLGLPKKSNNSTTLLDSQNHQEKFPEYLQ